MPRARKAAATGAGGAGAGAAAAGKLPKMSAKELAALRKKSFARGWNDMTHLEVKRFANDDPRLTAGARKRVPEDVFVDYSPTARAVCKECGQKIAPKGALRVVFLVQCHKGYKNNAPCHLDCAFKYNGATAMAKIDSIDEFKGLSLLSKEDRDALTSRFEASKVNSTKVKAEQQKASSKAVAYLDLILAALADAGPAGTKKGVAQTDIEKAVEAALAECAGRKYARASLRRALKAGVASGVLLQAAQSNSYSLA